MQSFWNKPAKCMIETGLIGRYIVEAAGWIEKNASRNALQIELMTYIIKIYLDSHLVRKFFPCKYQVPG